MNAKSIAAEQQTIESPHEIISWSVYRKRLTEASGFSIVQSLAGHCYGHAAAGLIGPSRFVMSYGMKLAFFQALFTNRPWSA
ncbi:hypothetical protein [Phyllobacterium phragmitis]|uniref:hypothetical protein n=1 Tax=Phyllobacterium phragmitis TaxID=2670329 RepID=UPI0011B288D3|nr:hypothetical protein [Phyllobacterium phragmitis]